LNIRKISTYEVRFSGSEINALVASEIVDEAPDRYLDSAELECLRARCIATLKDEGIDDFSAEAWQHFSPRQRTLYRIARNLEDAR
jgi:hypothetical protein